MLKRTGIWRYAHQLLENRSPIGSLGVSRGITLARRRTEIAELEILRNLPE